MKVFTSRYSNRDLAKSIAAKVGITLYPPKFPLAYKVEQNLSLLAPPRSIFHNCDQRTFERKYREHLDRLGAEKIRKLLEDASGGRDLVLLCFEDVTSPDKENNWCHRTMLANWLKENLGLDVQEYPDSGNYASKHKCDCEQIKLF